MRLLPTFLVSCLVAGSAHAGNISFLYKFAAPILGANQSIAQLNVETTVVSSALSQNQALAAPTLAMKLVPNPLIVPTPNCADTPQFCMNVPKTVDGVDPKTMANPQFFFVPNSFATTLGKEMNTNLKAAGVPAGTTVRTD